MRQYWRVVVLSVGFALCASHPAASSEAALPAYGDRIIVGSIGEPSMLIPPLATDSPSREVCRWLYVALLKYDKNLKIAPWAAESYEVLDAGLRLRFRLRPGIYWQDGVEVTAEDVAFTFRFMIDPTTPTAYAGGYKAVSELTVLSRYEVEIRYARPYARSIETWMDAILPRHLLDVDDPRLACLLPYPVLRNFIKAHLPEDAAVEKAKREKIAALSRNPVGCGPFLFAEWLPGSRVALKANPRYFLGRPGLDGIIMSLIPDTTTMFLELRADKVDMMGLSPQQYLYQTPPEFRARHALFRDLAFSYTYLGYNLRSPLFRDRRVRQALAHAIDKNAVVAGALMGQGKTTLGPYIPGTWVYNASLADYPYSLEKAKALLAEAGWRPDKTGRLRKDGLPFVFTALTNQGNEQRVKAAVIIQAQLKKLGIDMRIRTLEWAVFFSQFVDKGFFDACILGWTVPLDPDLYDVWHASRIKSPGLNFVGYANAEMDALLEKARATFDAAERKRLYDRAQAILHEDQPYCFLYVPYSLTAVQKRFQNLEEAPAGIGWNMERWWVPPALQRHVAVP